MSPNDLWLQIYQLLLTVFPHGLVTQVIGQDLTVEFWNTLRGSPTCYIARVMPTSEKLVLQRQERHNGGLTYPVLSQWNRPFHGMGDIYLWLNQLRQADCFPESNDYDILHGSGELPGLEKRHNLVSAAYLARRWFHVEDETRQKLLFPETATNKEEAFIWFPNRTKMCVRGKPTKMRRSTANVVYNLNFVRLLDTSKTRVRGLATIDDLHGEPAKEVISYIDDLARIYFHSHEKLLNPTTPDEPEEDLAPLW